MSLRTSLLAAITLLLTPSFTQDTSIAPAQSTSISAALASYESSLLHGPVATSLALAVLNTVPVAQLSSFAAQVEGLAPFPTTDQYSFATAPPVTNTMTPAWVMTLPAAVQADLIALRSSAVEAEASIIGGVLGIQQAGSVDSMTTASMTASASMAATSAMGTGTSDAMRVGGSGLGFSLGAVMVVGVIVATL